MLETRILDRINFFFGLQTKAFWAFWGFILSKTRAPDRINFLAYKQRCFSKVYPIILSGLGTLDRINFPYGRGEA